MNKLPVTRLNYFEVKQFAHDLVHTDDCFYECYSSVYEEWRDEFNEKFGFDIDCFLIILEHLLPLIDVSVGTTGKYKGFSNLNGMWFVKEKIDNE